jgi:hypothetical protein
MPKIKKIKKNIKQKGGLIDIISASIGIVNSMVSLGDNIFNEIHTITHIKDDINRGVPSTGIPNNSTPSPTFTSPSL